MAVGTGEECQSVHSSVVLPDGGSNSPQPLSSISYAEVPDFMKSEMCLNSVPHLQNCTTLKGDKVYNNYTCILDADVEKGKQEIPKSNAESIAILKSDDSFTRVLQREICLQMGGKLMHLLTNQSTDLPKFNSREKALTERLYDPATNRSRKYKRSTSFNSRRVVLLFSVLSSIGTIILIYLTLRVRQFADASGNL